LTPRERGFLLLSSHLGDPGRKVLTPAQLRTLFHRVTSDDPKRDDRDVLPEDLLALGFDRTFAERVVQLLSEEERLDWYLQKGRAAGCVPITRISAGYPKILRHRMGADSPGCLWCKGDLSLLETSGIALVGSRQLQAPNKLFAAEAGRQAALQGFTLISGNAAGADRMAQDSCLYWGGRVISIVADNLQQHSCKNHLLYVSEHGFDLPFSAPRALSRNRIIHSLGHLTLVAQSSYKTGGTWSGTVTNLSKQYSPVFCFDDGSPAAEELAQRGAGRITLHGLKDLSLLQPEEQNFFGQ